MTKIAHDEALSHVKSLHDLTRLVQRASGFPEILAALKNGHSETLDGVGFGGAARRRRVGVARALDVARRACARRRRRRFPRRSRHVFGP